MAKLTPRKQPAQARSRHTVDAIVEAAGQVLVKEGMPRATTHRIAERAGVSVGTLYQYFPNKTAIFAELYRRWAEGFEPTIEALGETLGQDPGGIGSLVEALALGTERMVASLREAPQLAKALLEHRAEILSREERRERQARIESTLAAALDAWPEALRIDDVSLTAFVVMRSWEALVMAAVIERPQTLEDGSLVRELTALLSRYLRG